MAKQTFTPKSESMSKWYTQVIQQAQLADYSPVKGCMVMRPNGYGIWENIQKAFDPMLKNLGVKNAYFPVFVPLSLLDKEAGHVEGFAPELAVVTHGGGKELQEKLAVRPTSEAIMYEMYSKWVHSHRDLPLNLNQWNNVVRWEKRTYFFLRTTEFLWQEAHTAHATHEESWKIVLDILDAYQVLAEKYLAIPVVKGRKSKAETFPGGNLTTTIESMMPNGKALQSATSHDLGQNFSKASAFNISFQTAKGETNYAWQGSHGLSTRIIGAIIMTHGDDDGLVLPPRIATTQIMIVPASDSEAVTKECNDLKDSLSKQEYSDNKIRAEIYPNSNKKLGWKLNDVEVQGIPLIVIIGEKELAENKITLVTRHTKEKEQVSADKFAKDAASLLEDIQNDLFKKAQQRSNKLTTEVETYDEFKKVMESTRGYINAFWCEEEACEAAIKEETKATTRCLPFIDNKGNVKEEKGECIKCGKASTHRWMFALAY